MSIWAMNQCLQKAKFNDAILVTDKNILHDVPKNIHIESAPPIDCIADYSNYLQSDLSSYIQGTHMLVMQWDSFIVNPQLWDDHFLDYDYIGAVWPWHPEGFRVGNGGFSLRSKVLCELTAEPEFVYKDRNEDDLICHINRDYLVRNQVRFAPEELARQFSFERELSNVPSFGFHGEYHMDKYL